MRKYRRLIACVLSVWVIYFVISLTVGTNICKEKEADSSRIEVIVEQEDALLALPIEEYIKRLLPCTIDVNCEKEVLKAQAVLLRSGIVYQALQIDQKNRKNLNKRQIREKQLGYQIKRAEYNTKKWKEQIQNNYEKIQQAVKETEGIVLIYQDNIIPGAYTELSAAKTRQAKAITYLKSVECNQNIEEKNYISYAYLDASVRAKIIQKDQDGYVEYVLVNGRILEGERFREKYKIASANFVIRNNQIKCRGRGHGYGFDQYYSNLLIKNKTVKTYMELLRYFFDGISFEKYEWDV